MMVTVTCPLCGEASSLGVDAFRSAAAFACERCGAVVPWASCPEPEPQARATTRPSRGRVPGSPGRALAPEGSAPR